MQEIDYLIVGQGLAGSVLAVQLMECGQRVLVIDAEAESSSSKIAAGLCNPIVFKRLTKSWLLDDVLDEAREFYRNLERQFNDTFFFDVPIYKLFVSEEEQSFWKQKSNEPDLFDWLSPKIDHPFDEHILRPFGAAHVLKSGYLNTEKWLGIIKKHLKENNSYLNSKFDHSSIELTDDSVSWGAYQAKKIIFCEGYQCTKNPFFDWLPFKLTKGETISVELKNTNLDVAINKGAFVLPMGEYYKVGATYDWENLNEETTAQGKEELLNKISKFIEDDVKVVNHRAGVRPTVKDRRPLIGLHPDYPQLAVFNGMGTKGVMYAPHLAKALIALLIENKALASDIDINRFVT